MDGLHEANILQKSDVVHGAQLGMVLGAVLGVILGGIMVLAGAADDHWQIFTVLGSGIMGALFGLWAASMVGSAVPNSRLRRFQQAIDDGKLLLMVDVPKYRVEEIRAMLNAEHPEAEDRGIDPYIPAFP
jgi:membrane protein DedA with SNARE-associated domain